MQRQGMTEATPRQSQGSNKMLDIFGRLTGRSGFSAAAPVEKVGGTAEKKPATTEQIKGVGSTTTAIAFGVELVAEQQPEIAELVLVPAVTNQEAQTGEATVAAPVSYPRPEYLSPNQILDQLHAYNATHHNITFGVDHGKLAS